MKVILKQNVKGLGFELDVKQVKDGYAKNFLIPRGLAVPATDRDIKELESKKRVWLEKERLLTEKLEKIGEKLRGGNFNFSVKTGGKNEVFGSISREDVKKAVLDSAPDLTENDLEVLLERPIKALGEYETEITLGRKIKSRVKITVRSQP